MRKIQINDARLDESKERGVIPDVIGIDKPEVVLSDYVIDYTRLNIDQRVLMESETDDCDFRYTYGLDLVNVKATGEGTSWWAQSVKKCVYSDYVHADRLAGRLPINGDGQPDNPKPTAPRTT